jgi:hypothetical protein
MARGNIDHISDHELLDTPIKNLGIDFNTLPHPKAINQLKSKLKKRGIKISPLIWASDEWFCPEGKSSIAIPFTLFHPRLIKLEKKHLGFCEGESEKEFYQLLVHECGHAIDHAYKLKKDVFRNEFFGDSNIPYPQYYLPKPFSKNFVKHLKNNYAQSHPDEDFAETFSVWLGNKREWKQKYSAGALDKLLYMDYLMQEIKGQAPLVNTKQKVLKASEDTRTLREYFQWKKKSFGVQGSRFYKNKLDLNFESLNHKFTLKPIEKEICHTISKRTKIKKYIVKSMLKELEKEMIMKKVSLKLSSIKNRKKIEKLIYENSFEFLKKNSHRIKM